MVTKNVHILISSVVPSNILASQENEIKLTKKNPKWPPTFSRISVLSLTDLSRRKKRGRFNYLWRLGHAAFNFYMETILQLSLIMMFKVSLMMLLLRVNRKLMELSEFSTRNLLPGRKGGETYYTYIYRMTRKKKKVCIMIKSLIMPVIHHTIK